MSSSCFECEGLPSGRQLYMQSSMQIYLLLTLMHVKRTIPQLPIQPSSWRWTLRFETCRRYQN